MPVPHIRFATVDDEEELGRGRRALLRAVTEEANDVLMGRHL